MATTLYLRQTAAHRLSETALLRRDMLTTRGAASVEAVVTSTASGTEILWTSTAGGTALEWISPPLAAGFTLLTTDTMTFNIWAREDNMATNIGGRARVWKFAAAGGIITELPGGPYSDGIEFTTADAVYNWTGVVSANQTFLEGDRIVVRYYITNVGTMAAGTGTLSYDGPTAAADGDAYFQLTNNVTFQTEDQPGVLLKHGHKPTSGFGVIAGHPLAPRHAWLFDERNPTTNAKVYDRVGSRHGTVTNSAGSNTSAQAVGGGLRLRRGSDRVNFGDSRLIIPSAGRCTIVMAARRELTGLTGSKLFSIDTVNDTDRCDLVVDSATQLAWRFGGNGAGNKLTVTGLTLTGDSIWIATTGPRGMELWQNGEKKGSNADNPTLVASASVFQLGGSSNGDGDPCQVGLLYVYRRQLTPAECRWISEQPYVPFQTRARKPTLKYTAPPPSTGGPYLMLLGVGG